MNDEEVYLSIIRRHQQGHLKGNVPPTPVDHSCTICYPPTSTPNQRTLYFWNLITCKTTAYSYTRSTERYLIGFDHCLVYPDIDLLEGAKLAKRIVYTLRYHDLPTFDPTYKFIFLYAYHTQSFLFNPFSIALSALSTSTLTTPLSATMNPNDLRTVMEGVFGIAGANITALTNQLAGAAPRELSLVKVDPFYERDDEDPHEWIDLFNQAAVANRWAAGRKIAIAAGYLKEAAYNWYEADKANIVQWHTDGANNNFDQLFLT